MTATTQPWSCRSMATAVKPAAMPPVTPADRSMSPSSSTGMRPIASTEIAEACTSRLAMFRLLVKVSGRRIEKTMKRATRPSTAGRAPMSPPRTRSA